MKTDDQLNDLAAEYANEKHPNPFFSEMRNISAQDYIAGFRAAEQAQQWILVTERTPEKGDEYNCVQDLNDGLGGPVSTSLEWDAINKKWVYIGTDIEVENVTYWLPIPSPPQTETESNHPQGINDRR